MSDLEDVENELSEAVVVKEENVEDRIDEEDTSEEEHDENDASDGHDVANDDASQQDDAGDDCGVTDASVSVSETPSDESKVNSQETESDGTQDATQGGEAGKPAVRKRYKDDFEWDDGILGQGAFGEVKRAKDIETGVVYAIKILNKQHIIQQRKVEWVNREKFLLDRLRHPFISSLFFTFSDPENLYFVLELCPGGELLDHIRRVKAFDMPVARFYAAEIILAIEFMHSTGVAHRDLKPENILLGQKGHVKIVDFGTARDFGNDKTARSKSFVGTAEYVCPELLISKEAGLAADLWSFGVTLFQMLAGKPPFKAASEYLIFKLIQNREFEYPENFPDVAKDLIDQLLELDPEKRIGSRDGGYDELKAHAFFEGIDWENIHTQEPPEIVAPDVLPIFLPKVVQQTPEEKEAEEKKRVQEERQKKLSEQKSSVWAPLLEENELIVETSLVIKKKGWSKVKRQLIMTDKPRIIYVDADKMVIKGEINWCDEISVDVRNKKHFFINVPSRAYDLQELQGNAQKWKTSVDALKAQLAAK